MPETPVYGFPFEKVPDDIPGITLHGGEQGNSPILAESVENELVRIDNTINNINGRLDDLESGNGPANVASWRPIGRGTVSNEERFVVDLTDSGRFPTPPLWDLVRFYMRFDLDVSAYIHLRINSDSTEMYTWGLLEYDANGHLDDAQHDTSDTFFQIGKGATVSTNNMILTLFSMAFPAESDLVNFQCETSRKSTSPTVHRRSLAWGSLDHTHALSAESLKFSVTGEGGFVNAWWWMEGARFEDN